MARKRKPTKSAPKSEEVASLLTEEPVAVSEVPGPEEALGPVDLYDDGFSQRYRKLARKPKTWLTRSVVVVVPALMSAYGSYAKSHDEAEKGYGALAAEVQKQGDAIHKLQEDNAEWRKTLVDALLKSAAPALRHTSSGASGVVGHGGTSATGSASRPLPAALQTELKELANRPMPAIQVRAVPNYDAAQQQQQVQEKK